MPKFLLVPKFLTVFPKKHYNYRILSKKVVKLQMRERESVVKDLFRILEQLIITSRMVSLVQSWIKNHLTQRSLFGIKIFISPLPNFLTLFSQKHYNDPIFSKKNRNRKWEKVTLSYKVEKYSSRPFENIIYTVVVLNLSNRK